jgi:RNA polymerase sigma-70 factor (ECF subfamily)
MEATQVGPDARAELSRAGELLQRLLEQLTPELRRVLVLAEIEELEVAEIARLEELKLGTAASRLRRARHAFQQALEKIAPENPFAGEEP